MMQHDITRCIFCISNNFIHIYIISRQRTQLQKFYKRSYIVNLAYLPNALKKILDKISKGTLKDLSVHLNFRLNGTSLENVKATQTSLNGATHACMRNL